MSCLSFLKRANTRSQYTTTTTTTTSSSTGTMASHRTTSSTEKRSSTDKSAAAPISDPSHPLTPPHTGHNAHTCCSFVRDIHRPSIAGPPAYSAAQPSDMSDLTRAMTDTIQHEIAALDHTLRKLSLEMHGTPEIMWEEHKTHDLFVRFFEGQKKNGWTITPHAYGLDTAWEARYARNAGKDTRTVGFQSEMDALPGIGHACGHNLIAISGVAAALSLKAAMEKHDVNGTIVLHGTPAEEGGGGKLKLIAAGAYKDLDVCAMAHPAPQSGTGAMLAVQPVYVTYKGQTAHAGAAPWEGINAQDAAVAAYNNISLLRQQTPPSHRVHGIIQGDNWAANVIPGASRLLYNVRAPTISELKAFAKKVEKCFQAAALATGCDVEIDWQPAYADVHNTPLLSSTYSTVMKERFDQEVPNDDFAASTDFGNTTYALPAAHVEYGIKLEDKKTMGNHTVGFTKAAAGEEAHQRTLEASLGVAVIGARVLAEKEFAEEVYKQWKQWRDGADGPDE